MKIQVEIFGSQKGYLAGGAKGLLIDLEVEEGTKVSEMADRLRIPLASRSKIRINRRFVSRDYLLKGGDEVSIFGPILAGGG